MSDEIGKGTPPRPLILIAGRNPDAKAVFGPLFDAIASQVGVFRSDFIGERWDPSRSLRTIRANPDNITAQHMRAMAEQTWGQASLVGLRITTIRVLPLESLMLVAAAQSNVPSDDRSGYWAAAFPLSGDFSIEDQDFGLDWRRTEDLNKWEEIRTSVNNLILRYPANYKTVRRDEALDFAVLFRTGMELEKFMKELEGILTPLGFTRKQRGWDRCSHGRYFYSWVWAPVKIDGRSYSTVCTECIREQSASK